MKVDLWWSRFLRRSRHRDRSPGPPLTDGSQPATTALYFPTWLSHRWICRGRDQVRDDGFGTVLITAIHTRTARPNRTKKLHVWNFFDCTIFFFFNVMFFFFVWGLSSIELFFVVAVVVGLFSCFGVDRSLVPNSRSTFFFWQIRVLCYRNSFVVDVTLLSAVRFSSFLKKSSNLIRYSRSNNNKFFFCCCPTWIWQVDKRFLNGRRYETLYLDQQSNCLFPSWFNRVAQLKRENLTQ